MMTLWGVVFSLHVLAAVLWVGGMAFALLVLRPSLAVLEPAARIALHRGVFRRFFLIVWHAMPTLLLTGYAMLFGVWGGFAAAPWTVHVMHAIGLVMAGVFVWIVIGPWAVLRRAEALADAAAAAERIRRLVLLNLVLGIVVVLIAGLARFG